jgi:hypothetical protein
MYQQKFTVSDCVLYFYRFINVNGFEQESFKV